MNPNVVREVQLKLTIKNPLVVDPQNKNNKMVLNNQTFEYEVNYDGLDVSSLWSAMFGDSLEFLRYTKGRCYDPVYDSNQVTATRNYSRSCVRRIDLLNKLVFE